MPSKTKEFPSFVNPFWFLYPLKKKIWFLYPFKKHFGAYIPSKKIYSACILSGRALLSNGHSPYTAAHIILLMI